MTVSKSDGGHMGKSQSIVASIAAVALASIAAANPALAQTPGGGSWGTTQRGAALNLTGYKLSFDDEFNTLDLACFSYSQHVGSHHWYLFGGSVSGLNNNPTCQSNLSPYVSVSGGVLSITGNRQGGVWFSGSISTMDTQGEGFKQQYGYYEARVQLPITTVKSIDYWPSFWVNSRYTSPGSFNYPELDILESWSQSKNGLNVSTLHAWPSSPVNSQLPLHELSSLQTGSSVFDGKWHTYGLQFTPHWWTVYFDGAALGRYPVSASYMNRPMYPVLDLAVSDHTLPSNAAASYTFYVDYVRVYVCTSATCSNS
jgi:hypothetical protein